MKLIQDLGILQIGKYKKRFGIYECPICKKHFKVDSSNVKSGKSSKCRSCSSSYSNKKHSLSKSRLHHTWRQIKDRCINIKCNSFKDYGERGITLCEEWKNDFMSFYNWSINNGYNETLTIDRINNDGNYEPSNCRWTTMEVQASNRRTKNAYTRGICKSKNKNKYYSKIQYRGIRYFLGSFNTEKEACIAYNNFIEKNNLPHIKNILGEK